MRTPDLADVVSASRVISSFVHSTSVLTSQSLNRRIGAHLYFKCENFQKTGAFKARGGCNAIFHLPESVSSVVTHSSGNHGAALSWAASLRNKRAFVICPTDAAASKRENITRYGGEIVDCGPSLEDRETTLAKFRRENDSLFVPPYDDPKIVAGQGTCALEFLDQVPALNEVWAPIGGGGLTTAR